MPKRESKSKKKSTVRRTLHYYAEELLRYKWQSIGTVAVSIVIVFVKSILGPLIFADLIGKVAEAPDISLILPSLISEAVIYLVIYTVTDAGLDQLRLYLSWELENRIMFDLYGLCFRVINAQSMQFHNDRFSGSLVSQTSKFVNAFETMWDVVTWDLIPLVVRIVATIVIMFPLLPWFAIGLVALIIVYTIISGVAYRKIGQLNDDEAEAQSKQTGQLSDSITNITSVKSYAREAYEEQRFRSFSKKSYTASHRLMRATVTRDFGFSAVDVGLVALLLFFLVNGATSFGISVSTLVLVVTYSEGMLGEIYGISRLFKNFNRIFGEAHDMVQILDMPDDVVDMPNAHRLELNEPSVQFDDISFKHADAKSPIFENFTLEIQPGERIGLVGVSGSGKTTLTKLLLRFADVASGEILISGQNIRDVTQQSLRENVAYVPQETALFHRSIADNIAYGRPNASIDEIKHAARLANAADFIEELPKGYDTLVGERGIKLSGGQRQRIAIARAILKDAPILVLDEATSALDSESEALIQSALVELMKNRTSLVIAHRLSTIASLDRIIVLENGKIVEQGTHQQLLAKKDGVYNHLWSRQSGAFMEE